jgi:hypothetical protein
MIKAVAVSRITLRCHEDTWIIIERLMNGAELWSTPQGVPCPTKTQIEVQLSGPRAAALLQRMHERKSDGNGLRRAVAGRAYIALAQIIDQVDLANMTRTLPPVILDDN